MKKELLLLLMGILIGYVVTSLYSRCSHLELQVVQHDERLVVLETERAERLKFKMRAKAFLKEAAKCVCKVLWPF